MHIFVFLFPKTADFSHLQEGQLDRSFQLKIPLAVMLETENDPCVVNLLVKCQTSHLKVEQKYQEKKHYINL